MRSGIPRLLTYRYTTSQIESVTAITQQLTPLVPRKYQRLEDSKGLGVPQKESSKTPTLDRCWHTYKAIPIRKIRKRGQGADRISKTSLCIGELYRVFEKDGYAELQPPPSRLIKGSHHARTRTRTTCGQSDTPDSSLKRQTIIRNHRPTLKLLPTNAAKNPLRSALHLNHQPSHVICFTNSKKTPMLPRILVHH